MPSARGNQPSSTGSNYNQRKMNKSTAPKHNKKVKYRKTKPKQPSIDNKQTKMINRLSNQVYKLQMASYGKVQQNFHILKEPLKPQKDRPLCLDLTDFTCERGPEVAGLPSQFGAIVYQIQPPNLSPSQISEWTHYQDNNATYGQNLYWTKQNLDQPDTGCYLAMNATYFVEVEGVPVADNLRVRFDVVSQKPNAILPARRVNLSTPITKLLPDTLPYLRRLANPCENRINPVYFKKYFSKVIFLNSTKREDTKGTTANKIRFSFTIRPNKVCVQEETNPQTGGGIVINEDPPPATGEQVEIPRGNFGPRNVPATQPLWMIISADNPHDDTDPQQVQVKMSRRIVWRDHLGSSNL